VDEFWRIRIVEHVDDYSFTLPEAKKRPRKLVVVEDRRDNMPRRKLDQTGCDPQNVVGSFGWLPDHALEGEHSREWRRSTGLEKGSPIEKHEELRRLVELSRN
jgi:hypothetical protein